MTEMKWFGNIEGEIKRKRKADEVTRKAAQMDKGGMVIMLTTLKIMSGEVRLTAHPYPIERQAWQMYMDLKRVWKLRVRVDTLAHYIADLKVVIGSLCASLLAGA